MTGYPKPLPEWRSRRLMGRLMTTWQALDALLEDASVAAIGGDAAAITEVAIDAREEVERLLARQLAAPPCKVTEIR